MDMTSQTSQQPVDEQEAQPEQTVPLQALHEQAPPEQAEQEQAVPEQAQVEQVDQVEQAEQEQAEPERTQAFPEQVEQAEPVEEQAAAPQEPIFDKKNQLEKVQDGLLTGEQIIAVYDIKGVGEGLVAVTNMRLIIQDNSFMGGKIALSSVPYRRVNAVSYVADKSMFGKFFSESAISISAGGRDYVMEFRSVEKARHIHDVVLAYAMRS